MKRFIMSLLVFTLLLATGLGNVWATIGLPTSNIAGNTATTATVGSTPGTFELVGAVISKANYLDGTSTTSNGPNESIIGKSVTISGATRTGDYTFNDAVITISDGSFNYLSATLSDIVFITDGTNWFLNPGLDVNNPATLNLSNIVLNTDVEHPSKYIDDLILVKGTGDSIGMKIEIYIFSGSIAGNSQGDIFSGLIDGVPDDGGGVIEPPSGVRTIGYWKNHDPEREAFIGGAVAFSTVFSTTEALDLSLSKKGKKTMEEKAKQQLAALLLNLASSLDPATVLQSGELEILQLINPTYDATATVLDALTEIENVINLPDNANMENAKDLADEINNRDHNNN
jgi:hypothetical protein